MDIRDLNFGENFFFVDGDVIFGSGVSEVMLNFIFFFFFNVMLYYVILDEM